MRQIRTLKAHLKSMYERRTTETPEAPVDGGPSG